MVFTSFNKRKTKIFFNFSFYYVFLPLSYYPHFHFLYFAYENKRFLEYNAIYPCEFHLHVFVLLFSFIMFTFFSPLYIYIYISFSFIHFHDNIFFIFLFSCNFIDRKFNLSHVYFFHLFSNYKESSLQKGASKIKMLFASKDNLDFLGVKYKQ